MSDPSSPSSPVYGSAPAVSSVVPSIGFDSDSGAAAAAGAGDGGATSGAMHAGAVGSATGPVAPSDSMPSMIDPRSTPEYQVAWELEVWRRQEQTRLMSEWREQENARMKILEEEWKKTELAREAAFEKKKASLVALEKKLQAGLFELQNQERQLKMRESDLAARVANLDREVANIKAEAEGKVQRIRDTAKSEVARAKSQVDESQKDLSVTKQKLHVVEARLRQVEEEYQTYRNKIAKSTTGELRLALQAKEVEIKRYEADVASVVAERDQALNRLKLALDAAANLKRAMEAKERERLELERKDMERLRLQYIQKQQSQGLRRDQETMLELKREVRALMAASEGPRRVPVINMPEFKHANFPIHDYPPLFVPTSNTNPNVNATATGPTMMSLDEQHFQQKQREAEAATADAADQERRQGATEDQENVHPQPSQHSKLSSSSSTSSSHQPGYAHVPDFSTAHPHYATFRPIPQTASAPPPFTASSTSSQPIITMSSSSSASSSPFAGPSPSSSVKPYHYFAHEKEVLEKVRAEMEGFRSHQPPPSTSSSYRSRPTSAPPRR